MIVLSESKPILQGIEPAFARPADRRFILMIGTALLCTGRCTIANLLGLAGPLADGHRTSYRRGFSPHLVPPSTWTAPSTVSPSPWFRPIAR